MPEPDPYPYAEEPSLDGVTAVDAGPDPMMEEPPLPVEVGDLAAYSDRAFRGALEGTEREALGALPPSDPDFTRAQKLLYQDAKARRDHGARGAALAALMSQPSNHYDPVLLIEQAQLAIDARDYARALERAKLAERHWARLPSNLIFTRKAMIYEISASANTGLYYASEGDDADALHHAIRGWEQYRRHAETKTRQDMVARADLNLEKLYEIQRRVE